MTIELPAYHSLKEYIKGYFYYAVNFSEIQVNNFYFFPPFHQKFIMMYLDASVTITYGDQRKENKGDLFVISPQTWPVSLEFNNDLRLIVVELRAASHYYLRSRYAIYKTLDSYVENNHIFGNGTSELIERLINAQSPDVMKD